MRISNSFSEGEIQVLEFVLQTILRGGSPTMATRHKDFAALYRKVLAMKKRVGEREQQVSAARSSVGLIKAEGAETLEATEDVVGEQKAG